MMDEPAGPSDAWSNVSTGAEGISPIHRPTSAPPVMELAQQLNAAELAQQGFLPMDPAYFGVSSEASNARDASGAFFGEHGHPLYLVRRSSPCLPSSLLFCTHSATGCYWMQACKKLFSFHRTVLPVSPHTHSNAPLPLGFL